MKPIAIEGRKVGAGTPTFVIAEIGVNHDGSLARALELVQIAKDCDADAVKLQIFSAQSLSDAAGEALVIVPNFPLAFTGGCGSVSDTLPGKATAVADPTKAVLVADADIAAARASVAVQQTDYPDPDALAAAFPAPAAGTVVQLSVRAVATADVEWKAP